MEENNNSTVVLDVKLDAYIEELRRLTKEYDLQAAVLKDMKEKGEETSDAYYKLSQEMKVTKSAISGVEKQMQNEIKAQKEAKGSLNAMRAELANMQKQYDAMGGFERMGVEGQKLQADIANLTKEVQGLEEETGRWQRNVGNYKSALAGLKNGFDAAGLSTGGLNKAMKLLSTNPMLTLFSVVVTLVAKLSDKLKGSEEMTESLGKAMDSLKPIFDWLSKAVSKLASLLSDVLDWAIEKAIQAIGWLGKALQTVGGWFGKDWGGGLIEFSDNMRKVGESTETTAEAMDTLATNTAKVKKEMDNTREKLEDFLTTYKKVLDEMKKEKLADVLQKAGGTKTASQTLEEMRQGYEALSHTFEEMEMPTDIPDSMKPSALEQFSAAFLNNAQQIESTVSSLSSSFGSMSTIYNQMAEDETKSEEERAAAAKKAKAWSALQIAANSGVAIAKGVASAMDVPWPGNIASLAATLAAVLSAIAQAKALAGSYETGGVIGGFRGATMGADNATASVRTGEMVINARQQRQLFDIANGGSAQSLTASLAAALQAMPAPVVDYSEFTRFAQRTATIEETTKLK